MAAMAAVTVAVAAVLILEDLAVLSLEDSRVVY